MPKVTITLVSLFLMVCCSLVSISAIASDYANSRKMKGYHISAIMKQWGNPYATNKKMFGDGTKYTWKDCVYTGYVVTNCQYNQCRSHKETTCCYQHITTDKDGVIQSYSEAGQGRCFNGVNYQELAQHRQFADQMYGMIGLFAKNGIAHINYSIRDNKTESETFVQQDCGGRCDKVISFHNACVSIAVPNYTKAGARKLEDLFSATHKDANKAVNQAILNCEKKIGQGKCQTITPWTSGKPALCAMEFR